MRITIASVPTDSRAQKYYKTKRRRKSRIRGAAAKEELFFIKITACACASGICTRAGRGRAYAYLLSKRKRKMRKKESGEHAGNRSDECMGNRLGESAGGARESRRNDWTDNHAKARAGKWLKRE